MSVLTDLIYGGTNAVAGLTENAVNAAIAKYGPEKEIAFPGTEFYFPTIYAATGVKVQTLGDLYSCVAVLKSLITNQPELSHALNAGLAAILGAEIMEGLRYIDGVDPHAAETGLGFLTDAQMCTLAPSLGAGAAVLVGRAAIAQSLVDLVKAYRAKGLAVYLVGDVIEQCMNSDVEIGLEQCIIPMGHDISDLIHVINLAVRAALRLGGVQPGDLGELLTYTRDQLYGIINTFGAVDSMKLSICAGAIALGFSVVVDFDLDENQVPGLLESVCDHGDTAVRSLALIEK